MTRLELAARLAIGREMQHKKQPANAVYHSIGLESALFGAWHAKLRWIEDLSWYEIRREARIIYGGQNA